MEVLGEKILLYCKARIAGGEGILSQKASKDR
jgi:hypothetical protein